MKLTPLPPAGDVFAAENAAAGAEYVITTVFAVAAGVDASDLSTVKVTVLVSAALATEITTVPTPFASARGVVVVMVATAAPLSAIAALYAAPGVRPVIVAVKEVTASEDL